MRTKKTVSYRLPPKQRNARFRAAIEQMESRVLMSATIAGWSAQSLSGTTASPWTAQTVDSGLSVAPGLTRDGGLTAGSLTKGFSSSNFTAGGGAINGAASTTDLYFDMTVKTGFSLSLSEFDLNYRSTTTGPKNAELDYSTNGGST
ncbi:MAG TPA: LEPR-XLL domain-containing protein [Tepidisphaeraceae bacterium]|jgi:hypothetical protein|nr:LEPR-XLL domain-containing protein [Tepidisphaeraceae bacterium]